MLSLGFLNTFTQFPNQSYMTLCPHCYSRVIEDFYVGKHP